MKNKSVQNCRFVHHAKFLCIMTTLKRLFKIEFERGGGTGKELARAFPAFFFMKKANQTKFLQVAIRDEGFRFTR